MTITAALELVQLTKKYGAVTAVLGPYGCGKTSTLRMVGRPCWARTPTRAPSTINATVCAGRRTPYALLAAILPMMDCAETLMSSKR
jgi:ABC-type hemin transport system ATPase subunit